MKVLDMHIIRIILKTIGIVIGVVILVPLLLLVSPLIGAAWLKEIRRKKRWKKAGFSAFLRAGAPLEHREFLEAFRKAPFTKDMGE